MILWIAPALNHYKIKQLNKLSLKVKGLRVICGVLDSSEGHIISKDEKISFEYIAVNSTYEKFSSSLRVYKLIFQELKKSRLEAVLMPFEKKHVSIIIFLYLLRFFFKYRLVSLNHHYYDKSPSQLANIIEKNTARFFYKLYDIVIFYTEQGREYSIANKMIASKRAFFANNTIDVEEIFMNTHEPLPEPENNILCISRIIPEKKIDLLIEYFLGIKRFIENCKLFVIGEGSQLNKYKKLTEEIKDIYWLGGIINEEEISRYMKLIKIVFVPGHSGLSIVHSFAYRKPYITFASRTHPPEVAYIKDNVNGFLLGDNKEKNIEKIIRLLRDDHCYRNMSLAAYDTAKKLTLENWAENIVNSIYHR